MNRLSELLGLDRPVSASEPENDNDNAERTPIIEGQEQPQYGGQEPSAPPAQPREETQPFTRFRGFMRRMGDRFRNRNEANQSDGNVEQQQPLVNNGIMNNSYQNWVRYSK